MRLIKDSQYRHIEKSLFNYNQLSKSTIQEDIQIIEAINIALQYFNDTQHKLMMLGFYFNFYKHTKKYTLTNYFRHICYDIIHTEEPNGYVIRREIVYKVAMICFELGIFKN